MANGEDFKKMGYSAGKLPKAGKSVSSKMKAPRMDKMRKIGKR